MRQRQPSKIQAKPIGYQSKKSIAGGKPHTSFKLDDVVRFIRANPDLKSPAIIRALGVSGNLIVQARRVIRET